MDENIQILAVDDEKNILNALVRYFRKSPYILHTALNANEAIKIMQENNISIIISDYAMPGDNGVKLLSAVKDKWPKIYRVLLTGNSSQEAVQDAYNEGVLQVLIDKPWANRELRKIVDNAHKILSDYKFGDKECSQNNV